MTAFLLFFIGLTLDSPAYHETDFKSIEAAIALRYPDVDNLEIFSLDTHTRVCFEQAQRPSTAIFDRAGAWQGTIEQVRSAEVPQGVLRESRHDLMSTPTQFFRLTSPHTYGPVYIGFAAVEARFPFQFPANGLVSFRVQQADELVNYLVDREGLTSLHRNSGVWIGAVYHGSGRPLAHQTLQSLLLQHLVPAPRAQMILPANPLGLKGWYIGESPCG